MFRDLKYLIAYIAPLSAYAAVFCHGLWSFATVVVAFVMIPLLEQIFSGTTYNLNPEEVEKKGTSALFDWFLYLNLPVLFVLLWFYFTTVTGDVLQPWEVLGITLSVGIVVGTLGINVAHELGHRAKSYETLIAKAMLTTALYTHFNIEHNRGHHRWVATPEDPSTARFGEPLYHFWARSIFGVYVNAWRLEHDRLSRRGDRKSVV